MAQPDLMKFRIKRLLLAAAGTTLLPATHAFKLRDGESQVENDETEINEDTEFLGNVETEQTNHRAYVQGNIDIQPPVAPGQPTTGIAPTAPAILPCGFAQTLTALSRVTRYNPISAAFPLADAHWHHNDTLLQILNARGNLTGLKMEIGQRFMAQMRIEGTYTTVEAVTLPTGFDTSAFVRPVISEYTNSTLIIATVDDNSIDDLHLRAKSLSADVGNTLATKEYTEFKETGISDRKPTFAARIAMVDLGDINPWDLKRNRTMITLGYKTTQPDGRYSMLVVRGQINGVQRVDIDGDTGVELSGRCIPSTAGGDELYIEFGDDTFAVNGSLPDAAETEAANSQMVASGVYVAPITWSATGLPTGASIDISTGLISGTYTTAGSYDPVITATDSTVGTPLVATLAIPTVTISP
jgi:hypothetical protein